MKGRTITYRVAPVAEKNEGTISFPKGVRNVKVVRWDAALDYSVMVLEAEPHDIEAFEVSLDAVGFDTDVKVFHYPVSDFNRSEAGHIGPFANWHKTSIPFNHKVACSGPSTLKGSSGAPYVLKNGQVIRIHVEGVNNAEGVRFEEGSDFESKLDSLTASAHSYSNSHGSISYALLISKCPELVKFLNDNEFL